jgi:hypothetical protein
MDQKNRKSGSPSIEPQSEAEGIHQRDFLKGLGLLNFTKTEGKG